VVYKHCSLHLSTHKPLWFHLDDNSILYGQPLGFNQELDLLCRIPVINWLIISGLVPLNYRADWKWKWWCSQLEVTYTEYNTSSRFLPCLVPAHTQLWPPKCCWNFLLSGPLHHTFIITWEKLGELAFQVKTQTVVIFFLNFFKGSLN